MLGENDGNGNQWKRDYSNRRDGSSAQEIKIINLRNPEVVFLPAQEEVQDRRINQAQQDGKKKSKNVVGCELFATTQQIKRGKGS